uniref:Uncharacterized protein n=1 Tax=Anguilla anguilla TaxID=7936 RepID=A0A0E9TP82_ANGAN
MTKAAFILQASWVTSIENAVF